MKDVLFSSLTNLDHPLLAAECIKPRDSGTPLRVFSDQMSELATHAFDFRLYFRFGIGSERKVVLVCPDRPGGVAGERGEPALLVQEGREVKWETCHKPASPPPHRSERQRQVTLSLCNASDDQVCGQRTREDIGPGRHIGLCELGASIGQVERACTCGLEQRRAKYRGLAGRQGVVGESLGSLAGRRLLIAA